MRIGGTVVGLFARAALAAYVLTEGWEFALAVGVSVPLVAAFLYANYTIAVAGITTFVLLLLSLIGEQVSSLLLPRPWTHWSRGDRHGGVVGPPQASGASVNRDLATLARPGLSTATPSRPIRRRDGRPRLAVLRARTGLSPRQPPLPRSRHTTTWIRPSPW